MSGNQQRQLHWSFKLAATAIAFLVLAIGAVELLLYERNTWDVFVNLDGETVKVTTTHRNGRIHPTGTRLPDRRRRQHIYHDPGLLGRPADNFSHDQRARRDLEIGR